MFEVCPFTALAADAAIAYDRQAVLNALYVNPFADVPNDGSDVVSFATPNLGANEGQTVADYLRWLHPHDRPLNVFGLTETTGDEGLTFSNVADAAAFISRVSAFADTKSVWVNVHAPKSGAGGKRWSARQMASYQFLAIDVDRDKSVEPKAAATDAEHAETLNVARRIMTAFADDLPTPLLVDSGNGHLLLYPIDLPYNEESKAMLAKVGDSIAGAFGRAYVDVCVVGDVARIFGVAGTVNRNKVAMPSLGRVHRVRRVVGDYVDRTPMDAGAFTDWAKRYIAESCAFEAESVAPPTASLPSCAPVVADVDSGVRLQRGSAWLAKRAPAIEGQGGDGHTFRTAGHLLAFGLSVGQVHTLMLRERNGQCSPPWNAGDLLAKIESAARNGTPRAEKTVNAGANVADIDAGLTRMKAERVQHGQPTPSGLSFTDWSTVETTIDWLWQDHLPIGVSLLAGIGGVGKSYVSLNIAAAITTGRPFADGQTAPLGDVILISSEDEPNVIKQRFTGAGGDFKRLHHFKSRAVKTKDGTIEKYFEVGDMDTIRAALDAKSQTKLIIVDPIHAFLGDKVDSHKTADVRRVMTPLVDVAAKRGVAVLGVIHFGKDNQKAAWSRISGSGAWRDLARSVFVACRDRSDEGLGLLVHEKHNYSPRQQTLGYRVDYGTHCLTWDGTVKNMTADEALNGRDVAPKLTEATEWLRAYLADGQRWTTDILMDGARDGHSRDTLYRAKDALGVKPGRNGFGGPWHWELSTPTPKADDRTF